jgi:hypothetical protein
MEGIVQSDPRAWGALRNGNTLQRKAAAVIERCQIFEHLEPFDPAHVSTIGNDIAVSTSDIDIICCVHDFDRFEGIVRAAFGELPEFVVRRAVKRGVHAVICSFNEELPVEIYAEPVAVEQQYAYRHYMVACRVIALGGLPLRRRIQELKAQGVKTEPALARILGLDGDPYEAVLVVEDMSDAWIRQRLAGSP